MIDYDINILKPLANLTRPYNTFVGDQTSQAESTFYKPQFLFQQLSNIGNTFSTGIDNNRQEPAIVKLAPGTVIKIDLDSGKGLIL